jgi:hypothetical protein
MPPSRRTLAGHASERVVRRPTSAKKSDAHQPEGPLVMGLFAKEQGVSLRTVGAARRRRRRFFHRLESARGMLARTLAARSFDKGEW